MVAFLIGFFKADAWLSIWVYLSLTAFIAVLVVPPWPYLVGAPYRWKWQPSAYKLAVSRLQQQLDAEQVAATEKLASAGNDGVSGAPTTNSAAATNGAADVGVRVGKGKNK